MNKHVVFFDMDGVVADFDGHYKTVFNRDPSKDDHFTGRQFVSTRPNFFAELPVIEKGRELVNKLLEKGYKIVFLTTPMPGIKECKMDKYNWIKRHFGEFDVIFSDKKHDYVVDDQSILIDDMDYNLKPWKDSGGTEIKFPGNINKILNKIEDCFNYTGKFKDMDVEINPTQRQKETGIYKKGKVEFKGLNIKVENPKGSIRWGFDGTGKKWINKMKNHYGYITGTEGSDLDPVDVFLGDKLNASRAFVINQINEDGTFDEHKIMLGFDNIEDAKKAYLSNYKNGWENRIHSIVQTNTKKLREWLKNGNKFEYFK